MGTVSANKSVYIRIIIKPLRIGPYCNSKHLLIANTAAETIITMIPESLLKSN